MSQELSSKRPSFLRAWRLPVLATIACLLISTAAFTARAATPSSGTISPTSPTTSYSAGPFLVANVSAQAGDPICNLTLPCDDFTLTVSTPAGYEASNSVAVKVEWSNSVADFDVYVLDSSGAVLRSAATSSDPETAIIPAKAGSYTVRVVPFLPLGQSFTSTASIVAQPAPPKTAKGTPPKYQNFAAPSGMSGADNAGEPSIGVDWATGAAMYQAGLTVFRALFNDSTAPATATWADKSAPNALASLDPILFTDHTTGRTFTSQLAGTTSLMAFSDTDGDTWVPSQGGGIASGIDHQTVGGGPFAANGLGALTAYPHAVYYCSQDIADALCALSRDGGLTFGPAVPIYTLTQCGGLHGHVKVAPDGTVYVPNKSCGGKQAVTVSADNGLTWAVRQVPGSSAGDTDPSIGIASDGTLYFGYQNGDGHARIAVSHDRGLTWQYDQDVGAALGIQNVVFPAAVAGDPGRAAFAFLGTTTGGNYQDNASFQGVWHLYIAHTYDGGQTWLTSDATPNDPVQRGSICTSGTTCGDDRNLLDFMDATVDKQGRVLVGYADGCTGDCVGGSGPSRSAYATIARQSSGKRLFAQYDPKH